MMGLSMTKSPTERVVIVWGRRRRADSKERAPLDPAALAAAQLVREAEAFLSGSLALERARNGIHPADWEWVNLLAHGTQAQLLRLALGPPPPPDTPTCELQWLEAVRFLADEMIKLVTEGRTTLAALQRSVLVPLELELASRNFHTPLPGPTVKTVLARLGSAS